MKDPYHKIVGAIAAQAWERIEEIQEGDWVKFTSPIEEVFFVALDAVCSMSSTEVASLFVAKDEQAVERLKQFDGRYPFGDAKSSLIIELQKQVGDWRVDFFIHYYDWGYPNKPAGWATLIVECDGHDFHERTKEQAARDRSRDRRAQHDGIPVLRFTGSELWRDPIGCAEQVIAFYQKGI